MINEALAGGTLEHLITSKQHVVFLRRQIHKTALTDTVQNVDDGQPVASLPQNLIFLNHGAVHRISLFVAFVEVISACPTNWHKSPVDSLKWIEDEVLAEFPLGEFKNMDHI